MRMHARFGRMVAFVAVLAALLTLTPGFAAQRVPSAETLRSQQTATESPIVAASRLRQIMGGKVVVEYAQATGVARFLRATGSATIPLSSGATSLEDKAYAFFDEFGAVFGVASARNQLVVSEVQQDDAGSGVRLDQRYGPLPVFNAELIVHFNKAGAITAVNGTFLPGLKVPVQPAIAASNALGEALGVVANLLQVDLGLLQGSPPELGVTQANLPQDQPGAQALVWKTTITSGPVLRQFVYIDAINGGVVENFQGIAHAPDVQTYHMAGQSTYETAIRCDTDPLLAKDPDCANAQTFASDTYNFFRKGFGRLSFDNQDSALKSYVHFVSDVCPNAFWNGSVMTYCETFPHDDVAGHEIAHGVTEFSANLVYAYQPGALNESFSDIFGEAIDLLNNGENELNSRWKIGEGIAPIGLRDMKDPTNPAYGNPDSCDSDLYYCGSGDSGGVHYNSGVPNKAFVLMVDGGTFNGSAVRGIGLTKAVHVQYRTLAQYLSVYSNFTDNYEALLASCRDLTGKRLRNPDPEAGGGYVADRITSADCGEIKKSLDAVRMKGAVCNDLAPAAAPALCGPSETSKRYFFDNHDGANKGWTSSVDNALYSAQQWKKVRDVKASGTTAWRANDELTSCSGDNYVSDMYLVSPNIKLAGSTKPVLRFLHDFFTEGTYDGGQVEVLVNGAWKKIATADFTLNPYNGSMASGSDAPITGSIFTGYRHPGDFPKIVFYESRVNLASYVTEDTDKTVQLRFRMATDNCNGTDVGWYLDDVEVYECKLP